MNEHYYADKRDLVKWASLLHIAERTGALTILQVGFVTPPGARPTIGCRAQKLPVQDAVWRHFRHLQDIRRLKVDGLTIEILDGPFTHTSRGAYFTTVIQQMGRIGHRKLVFLDPDTGLADVARDAKHVSTHEVAQIWAALHDGDCLVLYQHGSRTKNWVGQAERRFAAALAISNPWVYRGVDVGRDVVFLAAQRRGRGSP